MGSVEWITPSTLAIPVMRNSTRIKHVAHLVWLSLTQSNVLEISKIDHRLIKPPERTQFFSRATRSSLSLADQRILENQTISSAYNCSDTNRDNSPRKIPYYRLNQSTLVIK
jgi:hypothetical protein